MQGVQQSKYWVCCFCKGHGTYKAHWSCCSASEVTTYTHLTLGGLILTAGAKKKWFSLEDDLQAGTS